MEAIFLAQRGRYFHLNRGDVFGSRGDILVSEFQNHLWPQLKQYFKSLRLIDWTGALFSLNSTNMPTLCFLSNLQHDLGRSIERNAVRQPHELDTVNHIENRDVCGCVHTADVIVTHDNDTLVAIAIEHVTYVAFKVYHVNRSPGKMIIKDSTLFFYKKLPQLWALKAS